MKFKVLTFNPLYYTFSKKILSSKILISKDLLQYKEVTNIMNILKEFQKEKEKKVPAEWKLKMTNKKKQEFMMFMMIFTGTFVKENFNPLFLILKGDISWLIN